VFSNPAKTPDRSFRNGRSRQLGDAAAGSGGVWFLRTKAVVRNGVSWRTTGTTF
jgi:hypothetical protein